MKKFLSIILFLLSVNLSAKAQDSNRSTATTALVSFRIYNNNLLPAKVTVISYQPGETGNGTRGFLLASFGYRSLTFPVGTRIYLANKEQINTVMSGANISDQSPFMIVKKEDQGRSFKIK